MKAFEIQIAGYDIVLLQNNHDNFTVQYGAAIEPANLDYSQAAASLGLCIMHALSCDGKINNGE